MILELGSKTYTSSDDSRIWLQDFTSSDDFLYITYTTEFPP